MKAKQSKEFEALVRDTDRLMKVLHLNELWGRAYLRNNYRVASRWLLSLEQLKEFRFYLEQLVKKARKPIKSIKKRRS